MSVEADHRVPVAVGEGRASRLFRWVLALAAVTVMGDQAAKVWAVSALSGGETVAVVDNVIRFRLVYNPGAAFSIGVGFTWVFALASAGAVAVIVRSARRVRSRAWTVALGLLLGGAATHLIDRLLREPGFARGHVVDFIDYAGFFVGNVADIALTIGVLLIVVLSLRGVRIDGGSDRETADCEPFDQGGRDAA